jgi:hypothetical protein
MRSGGQEDRGSEGQEISRSGDHDVSKTRGHGTGVRRSGTWDLEVRRSVIRDQDVSMTSGLGTGGPEVWRSGDH